MTVHKVQILQSEMNMFRCVNCELFCKNTSSSIDHINFIMMINSGMHISSNDIDHLVKKEIEKKKKRSQVDRVNPINSCKFLYSQKDTYCTSAKPHTINSYM